MTRCKAGDLAVVVHGVKGWSDHLIGSLITVTAPTKNRNGDPAWRYTPPLRTIGGLELDVVEDDCLRPINNPGDDAIDETLLLARSPQWEQAHKVTT